MKIGPNLASEDEAARLARSGTPLRDIIDCYLQTCGPIYRVVKGRTEAGRETYVWVSDQVVAQAYSDEVISADEAIGQIKTSFPKSMIDGIRLVYIPDVVKASSVEEIRTASGNVFWQVTCEVGEGVRVEHFVSTVGQP